MITISCCTRNCHTHKPNIGIGKGKLIGKDYVKEKEKGKTTMNYCGQIVLLNRKKIHTRSLLKGVHVRGMAIQALDCYIIT